MAKELAPIVIGCAVWGPYLKKQHVLFQCDNDSLVTCISRGYSKDPSVMHLLKAFSHLTVMRIESASTISYLKRISPKAVSSRIKSKPHREVVLCRPMRINTRVPHACDPAGKTMARGAG